MGIIIIYSLYIYYRMSVKKRRKVTWLKMYTGRWLMITSRAETIKYFIFTIARNLVTDYLRCVIIRGQKLLLIYMVAAFS